MQNTQGQILIDKPGPVPSASGAGLPCTPATRLGRQGHRLPRRRLCPTAVQRRRHTGTGALHNCCFVGTTLVQLCQDEATHTQIVALLLACQCDLAVQLKQKPLLLLYLRARSMRGYTCMSVRVNECACALLACLTNNCQACEDSEGKWWLTDSDRTKPAAFITVTRSYSSPCSHSTQACKVLESELNMMARPLTVKANAS